MIFPTTKRNSNEVIEPRVSFDEIPLSALRHKSREKLSLLLNAEKVLVTEDGYHRDWRGVFSLSGLTQSEYTLIAQSIDKTKTLLDLWLRCGKDSEKDAVTLSQLHKCLEIIDRYDIFDDTFVMFTEDARAFLSKPHTVDVNSSSFEIVKGDPDNDIITNQDLECKLNKLPLPIFDAFVIFDNKDVEFATELIERCENMGYSLCIKDRDLLGGLPIESEAILNLLSQRCNRLIIIVSKAFINSPMQIFITNFAQALGIEQGKRKIIPCLIEECPLPQMLRYCFRLDFYRNNKLFNFWDKLDKSLKAPTEMRKQQIDKNKAVAEVSDNDSKPNIPATTGPLFDKEHFIKISEASSSSPKKTLKKVSSKKSSSPDFVKPNEPQIMPPLPKLRASSSMVSLELPKSTKLTNSFSQSTFHLNEDDSDAAGMDAITYKRQKWYKIFLPQSSKDAKQQKKAHLDEIPEMKEETHKRRWYKINKKKDKQKKIAIAIDS